MSARLVLHETTDTLDLDQVWDAFHDGSAGARDRLVLHYAPLVKFVAGRLAAGLPSSVDDADLVSAGVFGLIDAIERYDSGRGVKFETFAMPRIRGAILDELRAMDWVPRSIRSEARGMTLARDELIGKLGREPTDDEVAEQMGISRPELASSLAMISRSFVLSLQTPVGPDEEAPTLSDGIAAVDSDPAIAFDDPALLLPEAIAGLPERERHIVSLYYYEGMTLAEVGEVLGVSESRVCQVLGRCLGRLRRSIASQLDREALGA
ncbi:MAG: FliA/WhiG family RNA polymerase sigma factor [Actinomycetota bacterium]|nr:FliA/WhiG family RNA polymerase sigma factor [Actinomycetota bacterium]